MSLPTAVFLDTSVLAGQQYNFGSSALASFIPVAKERSLVLLLPDPTEREWHRQIEERSREALDALDQARRRAPFLAKWEHFPKQVSQPRANWEVKRVAVRELKAFLGQFSLQRLSYDRVSLDEIMNWYDKCLPPFQVGKKRKEFPDAIAIAILAEHAKHSGIVVAVVSEDQDFKLACDRYQSLLYFRSLPALTELLVADPADIDRIRTAILADVSALDKAIAEEAGRLVVIHSDTEYTIDNSNVVSVSLSDVRVVAIGASDCTLTFEADVETENDLEWTEWDRERDEQVTENETLVESVGLSGSAKVSVDPETRAIKEVTLVTIDQDFIEVEEAPSRRW